MFVTIFSTEPGQDRADLGQTCSFTIILITMCMYLGSLIAVCRAHLASGLPSRPERFQSVCIIDWPSVLWDVCLRYYHCMSRELCVYFWNFDAEDVITASLASSRCYAFVAVAEWMFGGHKWEFRAVDSKVFDSTRILTQRTQHHDIYLAELET